jgi:hypothetical protein
VMLRAGVIAMVGSRQCRARPWSAQADAHLRGRGRRFRRR